MVKWLPTPEQQAEIDMHWTAVRAGIRKDAPEPKYKTPRDVIDMHRHLASRLVEAAAWHAKQAQAVDDELTGAVE